MRIRRKVLAFFTILFLILSSSLQIFAEEPQDELGLKSKAAVLMDFSTGKVLYEKNAHEKLLPASVTKVMTLVLIMEALDSGKIKLDDKVTTSGRAVEMGGSQIFLEQGEQMTVNEMLKAIVVASANDASVAMGEHIWGSEQAFIKKMNEKAKQIGMNDTVFYNTTGLDDTEPCNMTSAYDIALMSRELMKHPKIFDYTTIWIDSLRGGKFGLANTNKLIKFYPGAIGLKTGSTSKALFSLAAAAKRDNLTLIASIMGGPTSPQRFADATKLMDYGFANYKSVPIAKQGDVIKEVQVRKGLYQQINALAGDNMTVLVNKGDEVNIVPEFNIPKELSAPFKKGDKLGDMVYKVNGKEVGRFKLVAEKDVPKINIFNAFVRLLVAWVNV